MARARWIGLLLILASAGISILWALDLERSPSGGMADFKAVYYGARCLIQHSDPYIEGDFLRVYRAEGGEFPSDPAMLRIFRRAVPVCINLPTTLFLAAPFSLLAWGPAHLLWMLLLASSLILAAVLVWDLAENYAPRVSLFLICLVLANSEVLLAYGNTAGIAVSLCAVAVWCFLKGRFVSAGVLCLAVSLAIKPHDAGLVWIYFLLAGGVFRKRALQALVVAVVFALPSVLWVSHVSPHWMQELHTNLAATSARGDLRDPGPASISIRNPNMVIDLQTVISVFKDNPRFYNPVSYLICGTLLAAGAVRTLRSSFSPERAWIALAAIVPLTMLVTYHRPYDAKLLLLTVPACAMLWAEGGRIGRFALLVNATAMVMTGDIPLAIFVILTRNLHVDASAIFGQILTVALMRPVPLILLAMGIFYLWVYVRRAIPDTQTRIVQMVDK